MNFWEELAKSLRDDADVEALKAKFDTFLNEQLTGVIKNKDTILAEKKNLQEEFNTLKEQYKDFIDEEVTYEDYVNMKSELDSIKQNGDTPPEGQKEKEKMLVDQGKSLKEKELKPEIEHLKKDYEETLSTLQDYRDKYQSYRVRNEVQDLLKSMHVEYDDFWLEGFLNRAKIEYSEVDDSLDIELYNGDSKSTLPLEDWKKLFPNSEQGKRMIKAPKNVGGGANGGNTNSSRVKPTETFKGMFNT